MPHAFGALSLVPPVVAIGLALWKKQLVPALFLGVWLGEIVLSGGRVLPAFFKSVDDALRVGSAKGNIEIIVFCLLVGALLALIRESNGFQGFISWVERTRLLRSKRGVYPLTFLIGVSIFIESYSSILVNGFLMRPIYDRLGISRERLAYFLHTVSINFVAIVLVNSWGAYYMSLLATQNVESPMRLLVRALPYNFYCLASLALVGVVMATGLSIGPMRRADEAAAAGAPPADAPGDEAAGLGGARTGVAPGPLFMAAPVAVLLAGVFAALYVTGGGDILKGDGASSVLYAAVVAIPVAGALVLAKRAMSFKGVLDVLFKGMGELLPVAALLVFALTLGDVSRQLGTGLFVAGVAKQGLPAFLLPALLFGLGCVISFATGTSYGTFAILVPIALPMAAAMGVEPALVFAACISGGVFGDNCSPLSDTSIVTGMAARVPVVSHIRTQIPYALIAASAALALFAAAGFVATAL
ncbi:MAG TPA: Na+/H+ antiporter NhaC family protein [Candidatus Aminicenantes bacterium]|nr:Na+/H+ antiporter NhaC family protein [Candidatus Aminicenantes bacterium]